MMKEFPGFYKVKQAFSNPEVKDIEAAVKQAVAETGIARRIRPGQRIAITAGSRGIANMPRILRLLGEAVRTFGGEPFLVAAMGSHGGGTGAGMLDVLAGLGITEDSVKMPIEASPRVVFLGDTASGFPVFCAREACSARGIIVVNRVKAHTAFRGPHESGLFKMMAVGLGRPKGAAAVHRLGPALMGRAVVDIGSAILERAPVIGGIGIVENGNEETALIKGTAPGDFHRVDAELLVKAKELMPTLPVEKLDLLVVREMGKNYSGTGMDTNVIGRFYLEGIDEPQTPRIRRIAVLGLSPASHGNANGVGLADFITRRLFAAIDFSATYLNGLTTNFLQRVKIPVIMPDDEQAVIKAWESLRLEAPQQARVVIIHDTLNLNEIFISRALKEEVEQLNYVTVEKKCMLTFNQGKLELE